MVTGPPNGANAAADSLLYFFIVFDWVIILYKKHPQALQHWRCITKFCLVYLPGSIQRPAKRNFDYPSGSHHTQTIRIGSYPFTAFDYPSGSHHTQTTPDARFIWTEFDYPSGSHHTQTHLWIIFQQHLFDYPSGSHHTQTFRSTSGRGYLFDYPSGSHHTQTKMR